MLVAVNYDSYGKERPSWWEFNNGFTNVDLSPRDLAVEVYKGHAYCACHEHRSIQLPDGKWSTYRRQENYLPSGFITLDFDGGRPGDGIGELLRDPLIRARACILYATASSTPAAPRTRVIFEIDPITDLEYYHKAQAALVHLYPTSDQSCSDPIKPYSGSPRCELYLTTAA